MDNEENIKDIIKEEITIPTVNSLQEIEELLLELDDEFRKIKMIFNER